MGMVRKPTHIFMTAKPVSNDILSALLAVEYKHLRPRLEHVKLKRGDIVYRAD